MTTPTPIVAKPAAARRPTPRGQCKDGKRSHPWKADTGGFASHSTAAALPDRRFRLLDR